MRVRTGENPSQITFDHPDGARLTPRADSSEPLGRTSRPSQPDPAAPEATGAPAAPAVPEVPTGVPGLTALPDDHSDELEPSPREECGVFGVWAPGEEVSRLTYFGLYALQHRGQESAGIATSNGSQILVYKDLGLVSQVFDDQALSNLTGHIAVGHVRYATQGATTWENAQPMLGPAAGSTLALAHNGNLTNTRELMDAVRATSGEDLSGELGRGSSTDTAVLAALLNLVSERGALEGWDSAADILTSGITDDADLDAAYSAPAPLSVHQAARRVLPMLRGAFSLVFMDERTLYAARAPHGVRPLVLGRLGNGWAVASETAALDIVGAAFVREIEPGELIELDEDGVRSSRNEMGAALAREHPVEADLVIATPESGTPAAIGYAQASGIPYGQGLVKNAYVGRTFIQPTQTLRQLGIRLKLNPLREVIEGKRLVVVDDSIVRGNTQRALVRMLREAGAAEVHVRISSPPVMWPCFYGIDFATRAELIATGMSVEEIGQSIGADSLGFLSVEGMVAASGQKADDLCLACFTGDYPIPPPVRSLTGAAIPVRRVPTAYRGRRRDQADDAGRTVPPGSITRPDLASGSPLGSTT